MPKPAWLTLRHKAEPAELKGFEIEMKKKIRAAFRLAVKDDYLITFHENIMPYEDQLVCLKCDKTAQEIDLDQAIELKEAAERERKWECFLICKSKKKAGGQVTMEDVLPIYQIIDNF